MEKLIYIASAIGLLDASYLSFVKLTEAKLFCTPGLGDCLTVNASQWANIFGIPVAFLGVVFYLVVILFITLRNKIKILADYQYFIFFFITLVGILFSAYLTYIEVAVLHTFCQWCVLSAIITIVLFVSSVIKLARRQN